MQERNKAYLGDNLELMKQVPDCTFDAIITDPPYNAGKRYGLKFDDKKPLTEYIAWMQRRFREMGRILKPGGSLVFKYSSCGLELLGQFLPSTLTPIRSAVWEKPFSPSPYSGKGWSYHFEILVWWAKGKPACRGTWNESDVIRVNPVWRKSDPEFVEHPCQMPLELCRYLVRRFSKPGDLILDPFLGSGSMALAAEMERRDWIGFEIETKYLELTNRRLRAPRQLELEVRSW